MRKTSDSVYPLIEKPILALRDEDDTLHAAVRYIVTKRDTRLLLRPFLVRLTYELCGGSNWKKTVPVGAAFELLNISSYQANAAFDNKHRVLSLSEKNSQFMASMLTREMSSEVLALVQNDVGKTIVETIQRDLSECNKNIYLAQHYDMNVLIMSNLTRYNDETAYLSAYTKRCHLGCGIFTGLCARAGGLLAQGSSDSVQALIEFGEQFGIALQMVNDLADFAPPRLGGDAGRGFQDQFSDLRNGRLTLGSA